MTLAEYKIIMKAIRKKRAEVRASPAAAKKYLEESGLGDILENAPLIKSSKKPVRKKTGKRVSA